MTSDPRDLVAKKLMETSVRLTEDDLGLLATSYETLQEWQEVIQEMVAPATEPALVFEPVRRRIT